MAGIKSSTIQVQKQEQRQLATVQQVLTAKLTELSVEELCARIESECENNPWLESSASSNDCDWDDNNGEGADDNDTYTEENTEVDVYSPDISVEGERDDDFPQPQQNENSNAGSRDNGEELSFHDMLLQQMHEYDLSEHQQSILEYIIGSLDDDAYLRIPLYQIADEMEIYQGIKTNEEEVEQTLKILQQFDPWGVGARSLVECMLIQAKRNKGIPMRSQIIRLLTEFSDELYLGHWNEIQTRMKLTSGEVTSMRNVLKKFNPRPGGSIGVTALDENHHVIPDFIVTIDEENELHFHLNENNLPIVTLADDYTDESALQLAGTTSEKVKKSIIEAQNFQRKRMEDGRMFIEALANRRHSMLVTMAAILKLQKNFFLEGDESMLRPMILEDVAKLANLDISTVSRVCRSKTVETPHGVFNLNWFFNSGIQKDGETLSIKNIMKEIKDLIGSEDKKKPYSDNKLTQLLHDKGYNVARRTVSKYRIEMKIPDSRLRR